jgi:glutamyl-tRNA(Gln) amidotransferase subunit D
MAKTNPLEGYSAALKEQLQKAAIEPGHKAEVTKGTQKSTGIVMPRTTGDADTLILKLDSGYNVGIKVDKATKIDKAKEEKRLRKAAETEVKPPKAVPRIPSKPTIAILHTGGTIASKLDYRTGATVPVFTAEEIAEMFPELSQIANIRAKVVFQMFSEDMEPEHWSLIADKAYKELTEEGCDGIIITHGTDTLHYTAAALSFALRDLPVPVLLVGAQRSSDRPSSDAGVNLICAARFIAQADWTGIGVCMHSSTSDEKCWVLPGTRVRKMHTSRRDTFRPINAEPVAEIDYALNSIKMLAKKYPKKDLARIPKLFKAFDRNVALIKMRPGFRAEELDFYATHMRGIVLEGTGLGHAPINHRDEATSGHPYLLKKLEQMAKKAAVYMASQCIYGRVNLNVYSTGRDLKAAGIKEAFMLPETAFVKLCWALGQTKDLKKAHELMEKDVAGETILRSEVQEFPDEGLEKE